jgi:hypothetical protein
MIAEPSGRQFLEKLRGRVGRCCNSLAQLELSAVLQHGETAESHRQSQVGPLRARFEQENLYTRPTQKQGRCGARRAAANDDHSPRFDHLAQPTLADVPCEVRKWLP